MNCRFLLSALALAALPAWAGAADLDLSAALAGDAPPSVRIGVTDLDVAGNTLAFGISDRALDVSVGRTLDLSVAGTASARLLAGYAFSGGGRLGLLGSGAVGPVAVNVGASVWNAPLTEFDPLAELSFEGASTEPSGWTLDLGARYRLRRDLVLQASGNLGQQPNVAAGLEWRRGELSLRGGLRAGQDVAGATLGATLRRGDLTLAADALLGPNSLGVTGSLSFADPLSVPSDLSLYAAYEPWRQHALALRVGATLSAQLGPGEFSGEVRGGAQTLGVRLGYTLPLAPGGE